MPQQCAIAQESRSHTYYIHLTTTIVYAIIYCAVLYLRTLISNRNNANVFVKIDFCDKPLSENYAHLTQYTHIVCFFSPSHQRLLNIKHLIKTM